MWRFIVMNTTKKFLASLFLLTLTTITQPVGQLALDKTLGNFYKGLANNTRIAAKSAVKIVTNNPWKFGIGLGVAALVAATTYKPYTIVTFKDNVLEKDTFRTFAQLQKAYATYQMNGHPIIDCFYKNQRYSIHNDTMLPTLEPKTPAQRINELNTKGVIFCDLSSFCIGTYRLVRGFDEFNAVLALIRKKMDTRKAHPNLDKEFSIFILNKYTAENNFKLNEKFKTKEEAEEYINKKLKTKPLSLFSVISTEEEKNAGYFFLETMNYDEITKKTQ